ncbi:nucleotidyltransferase family protein [Crocosphaera sp. XPORK-15E]|uniref:nucleotidyltransferase family protein n=1 Tax=Crocosphaera sp. XPORK-15E TaxID=3110247 RepID=UPI002B1FD649|nr:nucleotidyltransferase family protein [Crocosphaera sp. XPORK-15E]MEA5532865.1 nucleotidyltransferase family protein [Crocosphaera sp. XPORK-15E]
MNYQKTYPHNFSINELLKAKREEIIAIAAKHGASNLRIFGSVARGEADENSDLDILVDYSLDKISSWFPAGLVLDLENLLGCKVDIATEAGLKERIRERVLREAKPL